MTATAPHQRDARAAAEELARLFPAVYLRLHARRDKDGHRPPAQAMAVLQHLALAGPLTVGEAARHFGRAQSAVSELVDRLAERGLLARMRDERDRRRVLVWLTPAGLELLERDRQVLSPERTQAALARMAPAARRALLAGMKALVAAADEAARAAATGGGADGAHEKTTPRTRRRRR